jgi:hypothetical protein
MILQRKKRGPLFLRCAHRGCRAEFTADDSSTPLEVLAIRDGWGCDGTRHICPEHVGAFVGEDVR